jgi:hypothetical protein
LYEALIDPDGTELVAPELVALEQPSQQMTMAAVKRAKTFTAIPS